MNLVALRRGGLQVAAAAFSALAGGLVILNVKHLSSGQVAPIIVSSLMVGLLNALFAVGIVLIYRASRVINFAHGAFFILAYVCFYQFAISLNVSYWLALPAAVLVSGTAGAIAELVFIRRFFRSARLIVAVVTLGLAQLFTGIAGSIPKWVGHEDDPVVVVTTPLTHHHKQWGPINFTGDYAALLVLGIGALVALGAFLRFTKLGVAIRGAAQNSDRASELGVNVRSLSTIVWTIGAALAGLGAALQIPLFGYSSGVAASPVSGFMLGGLAAGVIAGMDRLPLAVVAAVTIAVMRTTAFFAFQDTAIVEGILLLVVIAAFLVQRKRLGRADESAGSTWAATEEVRPIPSELARLPIVRTGVRRAVGALAVAVLAFPLVMSPSQTNLGSLVLIDGIVVISLVILTGWGGQVSLGQYALVGVGAFVGAVLTAKLHLPFPFALLGGASAGAIAAMLLGLTALRIRGLYLAVTTLGFAIVTTGILLDQSHLGKYAPKRVGRPELLFVKTDDNRAFYYVCLVGLVAAVWAAQGLRRSRTGRVLIAMRDNERAAQSYGVNLVRTRLLTFALSGFMAAAAGVLFVAHEGALDAQSFGPETSIQIFLTAIIGGLGSIPGALLGALYFAIVNFTVKGEIGRLFASALGVLLVLYAFPGGLGAMAYAARDAVLRRIAIRRRIWVPSLLTDSAAAAGATDRAPLADKPVENGSVAKPERRYSQPSRIRTTGASQSGPRWRY
ncbi:MAG TPA: ABC transporter permease [Acidimicrobiales bacterium]|nr:ABC transporter permease [Acidimicrobiales bacterium]